VPIKPPPGLPLKKGGGAKTTALYMGRSLKKETIQSPPFFKGRVRVGLKPLHYRIDEEHHAKLG